MKYFTEFYSGKRQNRSTAFEAAGTISSLGRVLKVAAFQA